jgi:osmotically-inducible protein OsmY
MRNEVADKTLLVQVNKNLARAGGGSAKNKIVVSVRRGDVTLSGNLQYEIQRRSLIKAASSVAGVRRVIDQLKVTPRTMSQH